VNRKHRRQLARQSLRNREVESWQRRRGREPWKPSPVRKPQPDRSNPAKERHGASLVAENAASRGADPLAGSGVACRPEQAAMLGLCNEVGAHHERS